MSNLLSLHPQTKIFEDLPPETKLEFCPFLMPEFMATGHEVRHGGTVELPDKYRGYFDLVNGNTDIFPGFFLVDIETNVLPKLGLLREFGFYQQLEDSSSARGTESCKADQAKSEPQVRSTPASAQVGGE